MQEGPQPIELVQDAEETAIVLRGTITSYYSDELYFAAMRAAERKHSVVVKCAEVTHLGAAAIQILLALRHEVERHSKVFCVVQLPTVLESFVRDLGLGELLGLRTENK